MLPVINEAVNQAIKLVILAKINNISIFDRKLLPQESNFSSIGEGWINIKGN